MKEIRSIVQAYNSLDLRADKAALATVVRVEGSSYRRTGARMLVLENGTYLGGISGGCLEGDALRKARLAIIKSQPSLVTYDTSQDDEHQIGVGLGCNGIIDVLFTPLHADDKKNPVQLLSALTDTRVPVAMITITEATGFPELLAYTAIFQNEGQFRQEFPLPEITGTLVKDIKRSLNTLQSKSVTYEQHEKGIRVFIEVIAPAIHLVLYGGNYDIYPLIRISGELGWDVSVVTNLLKADKSLLTAVDHLYDTRGKDQPVIDTFTAVLLLAHDYRTDLTNLQKVVHSDASYIGLLGPKKRSRKLFDELATNGHWINESEMQRIYAPAGLDIGATSPEEIALSIIAEIKSHFAGRKGISLRLKQGTIHDH